jgi:hypothetical protein
LFMIYIMFNKSTKSMKMMKTAAKVLMKKTSSKMQTKTKVKSKSKNIPFNPYLPWGESIAQ